MTPRLPPIPEAGLTPEQRDAVAAFRAVRGGAEPFGPFIPLLRSPEIMRHCGALGEYLRFRSALGSRLTEFVILLVARANHQAFEWSVHAVMAERHGVPADWIAAIGEGRRPTGLDADGALLHDAVVELERAKGLSDPTYAAVLARFGEQGAIDLCAIVGYYGLLALVLNVARVPPQDGAPRLPALPA